MLRIDPRMAFATLFLAISVSGFSQKAQTSASPAVRIEDKVDNALTVRVPGSRPAFVSAGTTGTPAAANTQLKHLRLMLSSSADQQTGLAQLMAEQQDRSSANFHQWLTPEQFGAHFGASQGDIAKVAAWLSDQGLTVDSVAISGRMIEFSGSVGALQTAFHTEIHHVTVNGEPHLSNTTEISIPQALAPVVAGVARLNDVLPTHQPGTVKTVKLSDVSRATLNVPYYSGPNSGYNYVGPGDAAVIYNTNPLTAAGIDGTGQSITIIAQSNIDLTNVEQFRSMFGLPKNNPTIIVVGQDPGLNGDDAEAYLDAEYGGALATGAKINFVVSGNSYEGGGVDGAATYAVENNLGDIISLSYGGCEYNNGASYSAFWNNLWQQAAAQGQTVFVSSGDSGAAGCTRSTNVYAGQSTNGAQYSVNSLGSSAYNVAVGGSMFVDYNPGAYWAAGGSVGSVSPFISALSYIPEAALNQGRLTTTYLNNAATATQPGSGLFSTGGGVSIYNARPAWQTGSGIPTNADAINVYSGTGIATGYNSDGTHRLVPDISNISAYGHDGTLVCTGSCTNTSNGQLPNMGVYGGTSVATPVQASIQALINQKNGGRQGNILPTMYKLANTQYTASTTACQATNGTAANPAVTLPASTCLFNDIVAGSNIVPTASSGTAGVGFYAQAGFDEATGLGSVNATNLANAWATAGLAASATTFTLSPAAGITHGATQNLTVTVAANSGTATPSGDVSLVAETALANGPHQYTLTAGKFSGTVASSAGASTNYTIEALPAGNYNVHVHYGGDSNFAASDSASIPVSIGRETSTTATTSFAITYSTSAGFSSTATSSFAYGNGIYLDTFVNPGSATGVATGSVTYALSRNGTALPTLTTMLDGIGNTYFYSGASIAPYYLKSNYGALAPGAYTLTATYAGDSTFSGSTSTNNFTVSPLTTTMTVYTPAGLSPGSAGSYAVRLGNPNSSTLPNSTVNATGTVSYSAVSGATTVSLGTCTLTGFTVSSTQSFAGCQVTSSGLTVAGMYTVTASYSGDSNYAAQAKTASVVVAALTATTTGLTATGTTVNGCSITVNCPVALAATISPAAAGTVAFYDSGTLIGSGTLNNSTYTLNSYSLTAGAHTITAFYGGSATLNSSTGTVSFTVAKSTPIVLVSATKSSTYGQPIALGASLQVNPLYYSTQPIQPTGGINFYDGATLVGTGVLVAEPSGYSFTTSLSLPTLTAGTHSITATYVGDNNFATTSNSFVGGITVAKFTPSVMLSSASTVYNAGAPVALTVTIPLAAALAMPTGTITFYDGPTALGTAQATYSAAAGGFVATYSATGLTRGMHTLSAVLASDTNYNTAGGTLAVTVNTNNVWVANSNGTVSALAPNGTAVTPAGVSGGGTALAVDNAGFIWSVSKSAQSVTRISNTGAIMGTYTGSGNIIAPNAVAIDGSGLVWIANGESTLTAVTPTGVTVAAKPYQTGFSRPSSIKIDASGNVWVTNTGDNSVSEVVGLATPVTTPQTIAVQNATPAAKP